LNRGTLYIAIFVAAILGLFIVQYQYLKIGLNLAIVQFNKNIGIASQDIKKDLLTENQLSFLVGQAITNDDSYFDLSLDSIQDASKHFLNDFITHRLSENGIDTDFSYRLFTRDSSFYLKSPQHFKTNTDLATFPIELEGYLPQLVKRTIILELQFKDLNRYFLSQLNGLTIPSFLLTLVIIVIFVWVLKSVYWQRQVITTTNAFINNLTHELKTPVFSIGLATKILEEDLESSKKPILQIIRQQLDRLNQHIDKVLELGKLEFQKEIFQLKLMDFKPNLNKVCKDFETLSRLENIQFSYELKGEDYFIKAEDKHLENVIGNILDNAHKYSENPIIKLKAMTDKNQLKIMVSDNGAGIDAKEKRLIFKKYYRVSNGNLHRVKGYGLGLSYVKEVIKKHKGKVQIDSELGKGTTVTVSIPLGHGKK
jgi:two-component system phosphate regulon sensor histidine kinase PhoR